MKRQSMPRMQPLFLLALTFVLIATIGGGVASAQPTWGPLALARTTSGSPLAQAESGSWKTPTPTPYELCSSPPGEYVANSISSSTSGIAVATTHALYQLSAHDAAPEIDWRALYDRGSARKPGQLRWGTGSTPTYFGPPTGADYLTIVDNADNQVELQVYRASTGELVRSQPVLTTGALRSAAVPRLSTADGHLYTVTRQVLPPSSAATSALDGYEYTVIDPITGSVLDTQQLPGSIANDTLQTSGLITSRGEYLQGTLGGINRVRALWNFTTRLPLPTSCAAIDVLELEQRCTPILLKRV